MKNWIARLFGSADDAARTAAAPAPAGRAGVPGPESRDQAHVDTDPDTDTAMPFWRWLCDVSGADAAQPEPSPAGTRLVLDELARLARAPGEAADLVPRVPEVIPRLLRSLRSDDASGAELARQVTRDPVLVAEVIREANSAFYRQSTPVRSVDAALRVLGHNGLRMLIARVAFHPIMGVHSGRFTRSAAPRLWQHAERCARAAALLAPAPGAAHPADPFEAYLAGLMIDVGLVVAFRLLDRLLDAGPVPQDPDVVAALVAGARELSARIALHWALPPPIAAAILNASRPDARPLARALGQADRLAMLRLLFEAGLLAADAAPLAALDGTGARVFERL